MTIAVESFGIVGNDVVVQMPGRRLAAAAIQHDMLFHLSRRCSDASPCSTCGDHEEAVDELELLNATLADMDASIVR
jgi:hypothetical protein